MNDAGKVRVELKPEPDGCGYFYGHAFAPDGSEYRLDALPPLKEWRGMAGSAKPDPECWIIFANGVEVARLKRREDIADGIAPKLLECR